MKKKNKREARIYVCHTFYHVYISLLKEMNYPASERKRATIVLSSLSTNFKDLSERLLSSGLIKDVIPFDEKRDTFFPELKKWKKNYGNIVANMFSRIVFTSKFAKFQEEYVLIDFKNYEDIYVFCDIDPIGIYLSKHHIRYHAVEDGYNCNDDVNVVRLTDPSAFRLKCFFSEYLNLIFMCNGYNKYCIDMEVNDISLAKDANKKYIEVSRDGLLGKITAEDKKTLLKVFLKNAEEILGYTNGCERKILLLTEDLCSMDIRKQIFADLVEEYSREGTVFIKPHPRDVFDYKSVFPNNPVFDASFPMEVLNFVSELHFDKAVTVFTPLHDIKFADEKVFLGREFMDKYEAPEKHAARFSTKERQLQEEKERESEAKKR